MHRHGELGQQVDDGRLGALIGVHPIALEAVVTPTTARIVERQVVHIPAIKPPHGGESVIFIRGPLRDLVRGEAGLDHRAGIDGLLIEYRPRLPAGIPSMTADRGEVVVTKRFPAKEIERAQANPPQRFIIEQLPGVQQRLR